jgi:hypothetical protein
MKEILKIDEEWFVLRHVTRVVHQRQTNATGSWVRVFLLDGHQSELNGNSADEFLKVWEDRCRQLNFFVSGRD